MSRWMSARDTEVPGLRIERHRRKDADMPRLDIGAVRATWRAALSRLDLWTLETLNPPAGGRRPRN